MDLHFLKTFRKVASVNSFTRTARELQYAQSTVTAHIKALEAEFNAPLFERHGRGVQITAAGQRLLPYVEDILDLMSQARCSLQAEREPSGQLTIAAPESIATYRLPPLLELYWYRYPQVRLSLRLMSRSDIHLALRDRALDAAFLLDEGGKLHGLGSTGICQEALSLVAAPDHGLAAEHRLETAHLRRANLLGTEPGCSYQDKLVELLENETGDLVPMLEFGAIEAVKRAVQAGLGVALLPSVTVASELAVGSLVELPWRAPFTVHTRLVWKEAKWFSPELELFISEARRAISEDAEADARQRQPDHASAA